MKQNQPREIVHEEVAEGLSRAVLAPGCFWCLEAVMEVTPGVVAAINGYSGGQEHKPTYKDVCMGLTGHREAVMIYYDSDKLSYNQILDLFWRNIDPTDNAGQFFDRGFSYTTAIFYETDHQKRLAIASKQALEKSGVFGKPIATKILPFASFYEAEAYHQGFYKKSPLRYQQYSKTSGRQELKRQIWQEIEKAAGRSGAI